MSHQTSVITLITLNCVYGYTWLGVKSMATKQQNAAFI